MPFFFLSFAHSTQHEVWRKSEIFFFPHPPLRLKKEKKGAWWCLVLFICSLFWLLNFLRVFHLFFHLLLLVFVTIFPLCLFFSFIATFFFYFSLLFNALKQVSLLCYAYSTPKHTWTWRNWGPPFCFCFRVFFSFPLTLFSVRLNGIFCVPILRLFSWCTFFSLFNQNDSSL